MSSTKQLTDKITELTTKIEELEKQSHIDPLTATAEQITKKAQDEKEARENAVYLRDVVSMLEEQLQLEVKQEKQKANKVQVEQSFAGLSDQADIVAKAAESYNTELTKLKEMGRAISSNHRRTTGRLALDDRIDRNFIMPKVEKLKQSIIIHTEPRNLLP